MFEDFKLTDKFANGTSLQANLTATGRELIAALGKPNCAGDDYKVSAEWVFEDDSERLFTLYDYKATSLYESGLPSPEEFLNSEEPYEWHIGASGKIGAHEFAAWVKAKIAEAASRGV